jgi:DNA-binding response OmpR family regulator
MTPRWHVLVVDDDLDELNELVRGFRVAGHAVTQARDGKAAWAAIEAGGIDVVLSTVAAGGLNGFQLCRKVKADPRTAQCVVFLMSRQVDAADKFWAVEVGALDLLATPVDVPELIGVWTEAIVAARTAPAPGEASP